MGLDSVELVIETEETFGIEIENKDAEKLITVGRLYEYVCNKCNAQTNDSCVTQKVFYTVRNCISESFNICKKDINPGSSIENFTKNTPHKNFWEAFSEKTSLVLPPLKLPTWINCLITCVSLLGGLLLNLGLIHFSLINSTFAIIGTLFMWLLLFRVLASLATPFRTVIPAKFRTIGGLSKGVMKLNIKKFEPLSRKETWSILVSLISEQLGIEKDEIKPESNFVVDFGID